MAHDCGSLFLRDVQEHPGELVVPLCFRTKLNETKPNPKSLIDLCENKTEFTG